MFVVFPAGLRDRDCEDEFVRMGIFEIGRRESSLRIDVSLGDG